jgi:hypothetical protein
MDIQSDGVLNHSVCVCVCSCVHPLSPPSSKLKSVSEQGLKMCKKHRALLKVQEFRQVCRLKKKVCVDFLSLSLSLSLSLYLHVTQKHVYVTQKQVCVCFRLCECVSKCVHGCVCIYSDPASPPTVCQACYNAQTHCQCVKEQCSSCAVTIVRFVHRCEHCGKAIHCFCSRIYVDPDGNEHKDKFICNKRPSFSRTLYLLEQFVW